MIERFTEEARHSVFFARDEAIRYRSAYIETEHLLLGILKENRPLFSRLGIAANEAICKRIDD